MLLPKRVKHRKVQRGRMAGLSKGGTTVEAEPLAPEGVPVAAPPAPVVSSSAALTISLTLKLPPGPYGVVSPVA